MLSKVGGGEGCRSKQCGLLRTDVCACTLSASVSLLYRAFHSVSLACLMLSMASWVEACSSRWELTCSSFF